MALGNTCEIDRVCGTLPIGLNEHRAASYTGRPLWSFRKAVDSGTLPRARFPMFPQSNSVLSRKQLDCYLADDPDGFVYFIRTLAPVSGHYALKIGTAKSPLNRLKALRTSSPVALEIVAIVRGGRYDEQLLHSRFETYRMSGEWFRLDGELLEFVRGLPPAPGE